jgi:hypothetical protein
MYERGGASDADEAARQDDGIGMCFRRRKEDGKKQSEGQYSCEEFHQVVPFGVFVLGWRAARTDEAAADVAAYLKRAAMSVIKVRIMRVFIENFSVRD